MCLALARADKETASDPAATRRVVRIPLSMPDAPFFVLPAFCAACVLLGILGLVLGSSWDFFPITSVMGTWGALLLHGCGVVLAYAACVLGEARAVSLHLAPKKAAFGLGFPLLAVEPVVWRLGLPASAALVSLGLPLAVLFFSYGWLWAAPAFLSGLGVGAWIYFMAALLFLRPGPGSCLVERAFSLEDLALGLRWALASRFLPAGQAVAPGTGREMALAALLLAAWVVLAAASFRFLSEWPSRGLTPTEFLFFILVAAAFFAFCLWLLRRVLLLFRDALLLGGRGSMRPLVPSQEDWRRFSQGVALLSHIPELTTLDWKWSVAPAGTFLMRHQETDRTFYWIHSGEAAVLARTPSGDVVHAATLRSNTGVGEIAFLDSRPRTADVLIMQSAVVASITFEQFASKAGAEGRERFRDLVQAGQVMKQSRVFAGIPDSSLETWIQKGKPEHYPAGSVIIGQGQADRWMGLVVSGEVQVLRDGKSAGTLAKGDVLGEIAFITQRPRTATLRAAKDVLLWRWEPVWLEEETTRAGLRPILETLTEERL